MKRMTFEGKNFNNLPAFYDEIERKLCPGFEGFGRNLDAFSDVLFGGFGVFEPQESIVLVWENSGKSKEDLGEALFYKLLDIIKHHKHISLIVN